MQDVDCSNRVNNSNEELPGNIELIVEMVNDLFILTQFCAHSRVKKTSFSISFKPSRNSKVAD